MADLKIYAILGILLCLISFIYWIYKRGYNAGKDKGWRNCEIFYKGKIQRIYDKLTSGDSDINSAFGVSDDKTEFKM